MSDRDAPPGYAVAGSRARYAGPVFTVVTEDVRMPGGEVAARDVVRHPGAAGVVALDAAGAVTLVRQYRHPLGARLWEVPAGLCDTADEAPAQVARRELAEEADLRAGRLDLLLTLHTSPGFSTETFHLYLARDLAAVPAGARFARRHEEADLEVAAVPLDAAVAMVLAGEITSAPTVAGLLAAGRSRDAGWTGLRPA
ncbi:ADP-ribose pyrophosphatase [Pilimelia terevasa]|uniref:ADP-ribose pyrophosphatase n=1 Tax=Pilimelia terevasa TaxID=53372 RepID=A0A8J3BU50_9ACTN|nr:NUDIX hydrolase [Pilimelia terevasa]GGK37019.1 ADP-ribose pyrophosphatase [Pilimelia terevasa]